MRFGKDSNKLVSFHRPVVRVEGDRPLVNVRTIQLLLTLLDILGQLVTGSPKIPRIIAEHGVHGPMRMVILRKNLAVLVLS